MFKATTIGSPNFVFYDLNTDSLDKAYMSDGIILNVDLSKDLSLDEKESRITVLGHFIDLLHESDRKAIDVNCNLVSQRHEIVKEYNEAYKHVFKTLVLDKERTKSFKLDDIIIQGRFFLDVDRKNLTWEIVIKAKDGFLPGYQTVGISRSITLT